MSLINKMLQDLDARGTARSAEMSSDVKPVAPEAALRSKRRIAAITAGLIAVALGVTAWVVLPLKGKSFDPKPASTPLAQATPPATAPAAPPPAADPTPVTVAEVAPAAEPPGAAEPAPAAPAAQAGAAPAARAADSAPAAPQRRRAETTDSADAAVPARRTPAAAPAPATTTTTWAVASARAEAEQARLARRWAAEEARIAALPAGERGAAERHLRAEQERAAVTARRDAAWVAALKRKEGAAVSVNGDAGAGVAIEPANGAQGRSETPVQRADNSYRRALASLQEGRVGEAIAGLQQTLRANPRHDAARQTLVGLLVENKRSDEAVLELQGALALDARQPALAMLLARLQIERGGNGIETLLRTLPYANGNGEYQAFLAGALQRQGRHREAIDQYGAALRAALNNGVWWMGLGLSLQAEKRNAEAADAYRRAQASGMLSGELQGFVERKLQQVAR